MRVLYMSGYLDDSLQQHGVSMERDDFIRKPFSVKSLMSEKFFSLTGGSG